MKSELNSIRKAIQTGNQKYLIKIYEQMLCSRQNEISTDMEVQLKFWIDRIEALNEKVALAASALAVVSFYGVPLLHQGGALGGGWYPPFYTLLLY